MATIETTADTVELPQLSPETAAQPVAPQSGRNWKRIAGYSAGITAAVTTIFVTLHGLKSRAEGPEHQKTDVAQPDSHAASNEEKTHQEEAKPIVVSDEAAEEALRLCDFHKKDNDMDELAKDMHTLQTWRKQQIAKNGGQEPVFSEADGLVRTRERSETQAMDLWERVNQELQKPAVTTSATLDEESQDQLIEAGL